MRAMAAGVVASLFLSGSGAAGALPPIAPPVNSATPVQIAAARAEGDALLFTARAQDLFDNETGAHGTATIILRHRASGFACLFEPGQAMSHVVVYPNPHRGDDVGCETMTRVGDRTTNFTRDEHSDDQMIAVAAAAIQRRLPSARPAPSPTEVTPFATTFPRVPAPKPARFVDADRLEEVISAHVDGWLVEARFTAPRFMARGNTIDGAWYATVDEGMKHREGLAPSSAPPARPPRAAPGASAPSAPQTPEEVAAAKREGDRIRLPSSNQSLFDNITDGAVIALRHRPSGLVCQFDLGAANAILVGPGAGTTKRADAVNCLTSLGPLEDTLSVMPNDEGLTARQALERAVAEIGSLYSTLRPFAGNSVAMKADPSLPAHVAARLTTAPGSGQEYVYASAAVVGDWIVLEKVAGPVAEATTSDLMGELRMITAVGDLAKARRPAPRGG